MRKFPLLSLSILLAACGGHSDKMAESESAGVAPKPVFKVKYIDQTVIQGLALDAADKGQNAEGKRSESYQIEGMNADNTLELIGDHENDLESLHGKCMQTSADGRKIGWPQGGKCRLLFAKLVENVAEDSAKLTDYLVVHAGLQTYAENKSGYAAVQNGRYVLELDSEGAFVFRRRHY